MNPVLLLEYEGDPRSARRRQVPGMDETTQVQVARLTSDVQNIQTDIADIKSNVRRIDEKLESIDTRVHQLDTRVCQVEQRLTEKINGVRADLTDRINGVRTDLTEKIEGVRTEMDGLRSEISSAKVWALGLYFGLAGTLLLVMAKGFKWL